MASDSIASGSSAWILPKQVRGAWILGVAVAALVLLGLGMFRTRSILVLEVDGQRVALPTHASTVGAALRQAGFDLYSEDLVEPGLEVTLQAGMLVQIQRAHPVTLSADGQDRLLRTRAVTVGGFLTEVGVPIGPGDQILLGDRPVQLDAPLTDHAFLPREPSHRGGVRSVSVLGVATLPVITILRAASFTLDDDGRVTTFHSTLQTVGQALQELGVVLFLGDEVTPGLQDRMQADMVVRIARSVPVQIEVDGHSIRTRTRAETVAGVLGQEQIALVGQDRVRPDLADPVRPYMAIRVTRVREDLAVEVEPIPFETVWVPDPEVEIDNSKLVQEGQLGMTKRRFRVVYENDREVGRVLEDVWSAQSPVTKTLAYGTKIVIRTMDTPDGPIEYWRKMRVYTVSYTAASSGKSKSHPRYGYTRLGWKATKGVAAVDPTVIPLRTPMYVPGYGFARAGDTGGGVKGKLVDLCFDVGNYESWHWWTDIYFLTPVPPQHQIRWVLPHWPKFPDRKRN